MNSNPCNKLLSFYKKINLIILTSKKRDIPPHQTNADIIANRAKMTNQENKRGINIANKPMDIVIPKVKLGKKKAENCNFG
jgi:hypothetical protein